MDQSLVRGEIDNRVRGRVTGRLWFVGQPEPVELELQGDAWRDVAGHRLSIRNPDPQPGRVPRLARPQRGRVGDITASRKVKVPDEWIRADQRQGLTAASGWHWANCLYLEWFSDNGRVVIESAAFELAIEGEPFWQMTVQEEDEQRLANAHARQDALLTPVEEEFWEEPWPLEPAEWLGADGDAERALTEEEAERLQAESDQLNDRVHERMEREGPNADLGRIIEEEMERFRRERGEPEPTPEEQEEQRRWIEEMNAAADEIAAADDTVSPFHREHPLAMRARDLSLRVLTDVDQQDWLSGGAEGEHPLVVLQTAIIRAGSKLAGALGGRVWPPPRLTCASTIVWLKRAAAFLHEAQVASEACRRQVVATGAWLDQVDRDLTLLLAETTSLIGELRSRLAQESD